MKHRKIASKDTEQDYYVPVDIVNVADHIHVTDPKPGAMRGYAGRAMAFDMDDGMTVDYVKGPWHTNSHSFMKHTNMNVGELHLTQIELRDGETGEELYAEEKPVLGHYYRGTRIARQLAIVRNKPIEVFVRSNGGTSSHTEYPDRPELYHPLSKRKSDS